MVRQKSARNKGVSPVVGFIMIIAIVATFMALLQSQFIPAWNRQVEAKNFEKLVSETSQIPHVLSSTSPTSIVLDVGVVYPKYPFLVSPPPVAGYVEFIPENVTINATIAGTNQSYNRTFKTSEIVVHPVYVYSPEKQLIYEYTAVFENGSNYAKPVVVVNQTAFSQSGVFIPVINATEKIVAGVKVPLHFYVIGRSAGIPLKNVTISFQVENLAYWLDLLETIYGVSNVSVSGKVISVKIGSATLYTPTWSVSPYGKPPEITRKVSEVIPLNSPVYVSVGSVTPVKVLVVDQFGNAYPGVTVNASVTYGSTYASVNPSSLKTNVEGETTFYVQGLSAGNATVNFTAGNVSSSVRIHVLPLPVPTATPVPAAIEFVQYNNLTLLRYVNPTYNATLNATVKVLDASGNPVAGVPVTISLNVLYYKGGGGGWLFGTTTAYTTTVTTDSNGIASLRNVSVNFSLSTTLFYKRAYTQLSASCAGLSTSATNTTKYIYPPPPSPAIPALPYTINYP